jgi:hypothetical protein
VDKGFYSARIAYITAFEEGRFKGFKLVGLELISKKGKCV